MDFKDSMKQMAEKIKKVKDNLPTEEATKTALILPFIQTLGYEIFNPLEVLPEMSCDIGTKKGEKIDYAIMKDGAPIILIECKHWAQDLNLHNNQLVRYFNISNAKFGILTNGIVYRFYTDLAALNKMDSKPFLEINMLDLKDSQIEELKKFHKSYFDIERILSSASELKYTSELKAKISAEFAEPSQDFVRFFGKQIYDGTFTTKMVEQFTSLVKRSFTYFVNDLISERLQAAIDKGEEDKQLQKEQTQVVENVKPDIITTDEEMEGFYIVKAIIREFVSSERITYKDTKSYFAILLDGSAYKTVCRFYFDGKTKWIMIIDDKKVENRNKIHSLDDIYALKDLLIETTNRLAK